MSSVYESPKPRVNSSMLKQYTNKPVSFIGRVGKVHPTGKTFVLSDGEGKVSAVELDRPLEEELSGVVEVTGVVSNEGTVIMATAYTVLREDQGGVAFDLERYNEALKVIHDFPRRYPFEMPSSTH